MRPFEQMPDASLAAMRAVFTDLDETLTTGGRLTAQAYCALERLAATGLPVVVVTGRPAGWADHIARMWPVAGVVAENGALSLRYDRAGRRMHERYVQDEAERRDARERLSRLAGVILEAVPGTALASDQPYRQCDLAVDHGEDVAPIGAAAIARVVALFEEAGARATASAGHVNGWFGDFDKLTTTRAFAAEHLDLDVDAERERVLYLGDSPNDARMFGHFPNAVGVANVADAREAMAHLPAWITRARSGAGFVEVAVRLAALHEPARA